MSRGRCILGGVIVALVLWGALLGGLREAVAQEEAPAAAAEAAVWLVSTHQNEDGGYASFSTGANQAPSSVEGTADALLGLAAAGYDVTIPYLEAEQSSIGFLEAHPDEVAAFASRDGGAAGKLLLALSAAGQDPSAFAGQNLVLRLTEQLSPTGEYGVNNPFNQSLALLGLAAVGEPAAPEAVEWLLARQATDGEVAGSWDDGFGTQGNVDATAMAIMALLASGQASDDPAVVAAVNFLEQAQLPEGGWGYAPGLGSSANSTALAVQALLALGEDVTADEGRWAPEGTGPMAALLAWQGESGAFQADFGDGPFDDFFATVQALPAAGQQPFPAEIVEPVPVPVVAEEETVVEEQATEMPPPTETPLPTVEPSVTPEPTMEPTEVVVVEVTTAPTATPTPSITNAELDEAVEALEEAEGTDPWVAWLLLALAAVAVAAVFLWLFVFRNRA